MNAKLQRAHEEIQDCLDAWTDGNPEAYSAVVDARSSVERAQRLLEHSTHETKASPCIAEALALLLTLDDEARGPFSPSSAHTAAARTPTASAGMTSEDGMSERRCPRKLKKRLKSAAYWEWGKPLRKRLRWSGWDRGVEVRLRSEWHDVDVLGVWDYWLPGVGWIA